MALHFGCFPQQIGVGVNTGNDIATVEQLEQKPIVEVECIPSMQPTATNKRKCEDEQMAIDIDPRCVCKGLQSLTAVVWQTRSTYGCGCISELKMYEVYADVAKRVTEHPQKFRSWIIKPAINDTSPMQEVYIPSNCNCNCTTNAVDAADAWAADYWREKCCGPIIAKKQSAYVTPNYPRGYNRWKLF